MDFGFQNLKRCEQLQKTCRTQEKRQKHTHAIVSVVKIDAARFFCRIVPAKYRKFLRFLSSLQICLFEGYPRLQESQILQNSSEYLANFAFLTRILQVCKKIAIFARLVHSTIFLAKFLQKFCKICVFHTKILTKFAFLIFDYFDQKFVQIFFSDLITYLYLKF